MKKRGAKRRREAEAAGLGGGVVGCGLAACLRAGFWEVTSDLCQCQYSNFRFLFYWEKSYSTRYNCDSTSRGKPKGAFVFLA